MGFLLFRLNLRFFYELNFLEMNALMNHVQLIGRLGADAEIKTTAQGTKLSTLRIATNEKMRLSDGEWKETTQWHQCVVWGQLNNVVEKFGKKGNQLMISGTLNYRIYTDSDGIKRTITQIRVNEILVLKNQYTQDVSSSAEEKEDVPF